MGLLSATYVPNSGDVPQQESLYAWKGPAWSDKDGKRYDVLTERPTHATGMYYFEKSNGAMFYTIDPQEASSNFKRYSWIMEGCNRCKRTFSTKVLGVPSFNFTLVDKLLLQVMNHLFLILLFIMLLTDQRIQSVDSGKTSTTDVRVLDMLTCLLKMIHLEMNQQQFLGRMMLNQEGIYTRYSKKK